MTDRKGNGKMGKIMLLGVIVGFVCTGGGIVIGDEFDRY